MFGEDQFAFNKHVIPSEVEESRSQTKSGSTGSFDFAQDDCVYAGSFTARTFSACFLRKASRLLRTFSSESARIATARRAAFCAPASPIAKVPTGMPPGICAMDKSESRP